MEKIEIRKSKIKIALTLVTCIIMAYISFCLFKSAEHFKSGKFRNTLFIEITGFISFALCVLGFITLLIKSFEKKSGVIIDNNGITDYSNAMNFGLIKWEEITSIRNTNIRSSKFLIIDIKNKEDYLKKAKSRFRLYLMKANVKLYGTPITISSHMLNCSFSELENVIRTSFQNWKENNSN